MYKWTKLLRIGTQHIYILPISYYILSYKIIFYFTTKDIYLKGKWLIKKQNLEHKCVLQESYKTVRRWQRSILLVNGGHCVWNCDFVSYTIAQSNSTQRYFLYIPYSTVIVATMQITWLTKWRQLCYVNNKKHLKHILCINLFLFVFKTIVKPYVHTS